MNSLLSYLLLGSIILFPVWIGCVARLIFKKTRKPKLSFFISLVLSGLTMINSIHIYYQRKNYEELSGIEPLIILTLLLVVSITTYAIYRVMANAGISLVELIIEKRTSNQSVDPTLKDAD